MVTFQALELDLPLRAAFSPAHPLARRDVPLALAREVRGRALREHRRSTSSIPALFWEHRTNVGVLLIPYTHL